MLHYAVLLFLPALTQSQSIALDGPDWEVQKGFRIDVEARGLRFPTSIVAIPSPGSAPDDPRFFVAELHGTIKVVTNNGTVRTFADKFASFTPREPTLGAASENGTAGMCIDPDRGFVFVTYVYQDSNKVLRNGMTRFDSRPGTFATEAARSVSFDHLFAADTSQDSHQIGPCQTWRGHVYVAVGDGVGDGPQTGNGQRLTSTLGKILRLTVDGLQVSENPFVGQGNGSTPFVWALGLRNVFSLKIVNGRVFIAENGDNIDRFLEVESGANLGYDGTDWSIGMNAAMVFAPSVSPVQMDYAPPNYEPFPPSHRGRFYIALAGVTGAPGPGLAGERSVVSLDYDFTDRRVRQTPRPIVRYAGTGCGMIIAMAIGSDGLYFAPVCPGPDGTSPLMRVSYAPENEHDYIIGARSSAEQLLRDKGCIGCHQLRGAGGTQGPSLDSPPLRERLLRRHSPEYLKAFAAPDSLRREPYTTLGDRRREVLAARPEDRPRVWLVNWLLEPRFAMPAAAMPNVGLTTSEAETIADYLLTLEPPKAGATTRLPESRHAYSVTAFFLGIALAASVGTARRRAAGKRRLSVDTGQTV